MERRHSLSCLPHLPSVSQFIHSPFTPNYSYQGRPTSTPTWFPSFSQSARHCTNHLVDVISLLPPSSPLSHVFTRSFHNTFKFSHTTPIPPFYLSLGQLHKDNILSAEAYAYRHKLGIPSQLSYLSLHTTDTSTLTNTDAHLMFPSHPLHKLKLTLRRHQHHLIPADKTRHFALFPHIAYIQELLSHLSDTSTYIDIPDSQVLSIAHTENSAIAQAQIFFKDTTLFPTNPQPRYLYLLPKLHKPPNEWKVPYLIPKTRPIICDTPSNTYNLSKKLLPYLQQLERKFTSIATSSSTVTHELTHNPRLLTHFHYAPFIITIDVESLFTRIPLDKLSNTIQTLLPEIFPDTKQASIFYSFIHTIITNNVFRAFNKNFLQITGLPMGGCLSGTLANIYLGQLELHVITQHSQHILLYTRYMDDILILHTGPLYLIDTLIHDLQSSFQLNLTHHITQTQASFLDLVLFYSPSSGFITSLFSKNFLLLKFPLSSDSRNKSQITSLIHTQLTRLWRASSHSSFLTQQILLVLHTIPHDHLHCFTHKTILSFFHPVCIQHHSWSHTFLLCDKCKSIIQSHKIVITKSVSTSNNILCSVIPASCNTPDLLHLIISPPNTATYYCGPTSIHNILTRLLPFSTLLPYKRYNHNNIHTFVTKHSLQPFSLADTITLPKPTFPCYFHYITDNISNTYGFPGARKAATPATSFLNSFKKASRQPPPDNI